MRALAHRLTSSPGYSKIFSWGKLFFFAGSAQILVQAVGFLSGVLVIRLLPPHEYALYSLANAMLGAMIILADGGIGAGVLSQGGKVWNDSEKLGIVVSTGLSLRRKMAIISLVVAIPILMLLLYKHGAGITTSVLLILSMIPAFYATISASLYEIVPKLHQDILKVQKIQVKMNLGRLAIHIGTLFTFPWSYIAIIAAGIPQIWSNKQLKKISSEYISFDEKPDKKVAGEIMTMVKRILPGSIYHCLSYQITLWLISIFGSTFGVAQAGALGRLALVLNIIGVLVSTILAPRFAKLASVRFMILKRYLQILAGLSALMFTIIVFVWLFSDQILWILGNEYANLRTELLLSTICTCITIVSSAAFSLCTSRGWAISPLILIPLDLGAILFGVTQMNLTTLSGIFRLNIMVAVALALANVSYGFIRIIKIPVIPENNPHGNDS